MGERLPKCDAVLLLLIEVIRVHRAAQVRDGASNFDRADVGDNVALGEAVQLLLIVMILLLKSGPGTRRRRHF
jgi:hypothetical protein